MFYDCYNLKILDLKTFNTSNLRNINEMFYNCRSLIYLNLYLFKLNNSISKSNTFSRISQNVIYCINDTETKNLLLGNDTISNCSLTYSDNQDLITDLININYTDYCEKNGFKFEYKDICYDKCPNNTYALFNEKTIMKII